MESPPWPAVSFFGFSAFPSASSPCSTSSASSARGGQPHRLPCRAQSAPSAASRRDAPSGAVRRPEPSLQGALKKTFRHLGTACSPSAFRCNTRVASHLPLPSPGDGSRGTRGTRSYRISLGGCPHFAGRMHTRAPCIPGLRPSHPKIGLRLGRPRASRRANLHFTAVSLYAGPIRTDPNITAYPLDGAAHPPQAWLCAPVHRLTEGRL